MVEETHEQNNENFWGLMKWIVILILVVIVLIVSWKALSSTIGKIFGPVAALGDAASSLIKECTDKGWLSCGLGISIFIGSIVFVIYMFAKLFIGQKSGLIDTTTLELLSGKSQQEIIDDFKEKYEGIDNLDKFMEDKGFTKEQIDNSAFKDAFIKKLAAKEIKNRLEIELGKSGLSGKALIDRKTMIEQTNKINDAIAEGSEGSLDERQREDINEKVEEMIK